jgi:alpha-tubulin suppressor-like RCC1 family protein
LKINKRLRFYLLSLVSMIIHFNCINNIKAQTPDLKFAKIIVNNYSFHAILKDSTLWGWGINSQGQLGKGYAGSIIDNMVPIFENTKVLDITHNNFTYLLLKADGSLLTWNDQSMIPSQVGNDFDWLKIISMDYSSKYSFLALKKDGTVWKIDGKYSYLIPFEEKFIDINFGGYFNNLSVFAGVTDKNEAYIYEYKNRFEFKGIIKQVKSVNCTYAALTFIGMDDNIYDIGNSIETIYEKFPDYSIIESPRLLRKGNFNKIFGTSLTKYAIDANGDLYRWGKLDNQAVSIPKEPEQFGHTMKWHQLYFSGTSTYLVNTEGEMFANGFWIGYVYGGKNPPLHCEDICKFNFPDINH